MSLRSRPIAHSEVPRRGLRRAAIGTLLVSVAVASVIVGSLVQRTRSTAAALHVAATRLVKLTDAFATDDQRRAAIAWGYSERLRLGLESPFRLIEAAARDPRLATDERRTVSWALLSRVLSGETHQVDAAALDLLGPWENGRSPLGEQHLALIEGAILNADNPRAGELAVRLAYTLASAERIVDGSAPLLAAEAAALIADREVARREASGVVRGLRGADPIEVVRQRRARLGFYVERPVLLQPSGAIEHAAIGAAERLLESVRSMRPLHLETASSGVSSAPANSASAFRAELLAAGARIPPAAQLSVTVQRYLPLIRSQSPELAESVGHAHNSEMLVAAIDPAASRSPRRALGRMVLASAVAMRSGAQEPVWFPGDSSVGEVQIASSLGLESIRFDDDVPAAWRSYFLQSLADGVRDIRRVLPALRLDGASIRFRMRAPADSALAMHDPRTRTFHFPVATTAGTIVHELAHDLDRQSAEHQGLAGYGSDNVARSSTRATRGSGRMAASVEALAEELNDPRARPAKADRPAEIFATRVDWFVANALASQGVSSGFLSAVQDEMLTGHVVHSERLRSTGSSRSLVTALDGMTTVAPFAMRQQEPSVQSVLRWALEGPVDRLVAAAIVAGDGPQWRPTRLGGGESCGPHTGSRARLIRLAAESRARGWLRLRARWTSENRRPAWARAVLNQSPWSPQTVERRVAELRDHILSELSPDDELPMGLSAQAGGLAASALCRAP